MKRPLQEDHFDIVDMASSYMEILNLDPSIVSMLAVEIDMKIRAILQVSLFCSGVPKHWSLQEAKKIMLHAKRKTMFTEDITNAMAVLNVPRVLGYQSALTNYTYTKAPQSTRKEWYHSVKVLHLDFCCFSQSITLFCRK